MSDDIITFMLGYVIASFFYYNAFFNTTTFNKSFIHYVF